MFAGSTERCSGVRIACLQTQVGSLSTARMGMSQSQRRISNTLFARSEAQETLSQYKSSAESFVLPSIVSVIRDGGARQLLYYRCRSTALRTCVPAAPIAAQLGLSRQPKPFPDSIGHAELSQDCRNASCGLNTAPYAPGLSWASDRPCDKSLPLPTPRIVPRRTCQNGRIRLRGCASDISRAILCSWNATLTCRILDLFVTTLAAGQSNYPHICSYLACHARGLNLLI